MNEDDYAIFDEEARLLDAAYDYAIKDLPFPKHMSDRLVVLKQKIQEIDRRNVAACQTTLVRKLIIRQLGDRPDSYSVDIRGRSGKWLEYIHARGLLVNKAKRLTRYIPFSVCLWQDDLT